MKKLTLITACILFSVAGLGTTDQIIITELQGDDKIHIACVTWPWCGGPDLFEPVLQPKDTKNETQDAKDEKVA